MENRHPPVETGIQTIAYHAGVAYLSSDLAVSAFRQAAGEGKFHLDHETAIIGLISLVVLVTNSHLDRRQGYSAAGVLLGIGLALILADSSQIIGPALITAAVGMAAATRFSPKQ